VNDETDLRKVIAYLHDLDPELEERSGVRGLRVNSAAREDMLYQLDSARMSIGVGHSPLIGAQSRPLSSTA